MVVMWILGKRKWKQTEEYKAYRAYKAEHKKK
jgi:hypothetical protein